jgi:spore coat protein CotH
MTGKSIMDQKGNGNWKAILVAFFLGISMAALKASGLQQTRTPSGVAAVLQTTNIWVVHFHFTPEAWKTLQPEAAPEHPFLSPDAARKGLSAPQGIDFKYVRADLEIGTNEMKTVAVRLKGNSTFTQSEKSLKHSIKVDLNEFIKGQKFGTMTKLNFHNSVADPSWMNEVLSYQLYRDAGVPAPRTAYAKVYVTVPGEHDRTYLGLYGMVEDVDRPFASDHFGSKKGAMFKPVTHKPFEYLGEDWANYRQIYDPKWEVNEEQAQRLIGLCKLVSKADDQEFAARISGYLDMDEFSRFMAVTAYLSSLDSILGMGQNYYLHLHPVLQTFQFMPWDLDNSFGQFPLMGTQEQREQLSLQKPWVGENRFLERMFKLSSFQTFYKTHLQTFRVTLFKQERLERQVDMVAAAIRKAISEESPQKLALFEKAVKGESVPAFRVESGRPGSSGPGILAELKPIKAFVNARYKSLADQMGGRSNGEIVESRLGAHRAPDPGIAQDVAPGQPNGQ